MWNTIGKRRLYVFYLCCSVLLASAFLSAIYVSNLHEREKGYRWTIQQNDYATDARLARLARETCQEYLEQPSLQRWKRNQERQGARCRCYLGDRFPVLQCLHENPDPARPIFSTL